jgi:hypothetical protein
VAQAARWLATLKASGCLCLLDGGGLWFRGNPGVLVLPGAGFTSHASLTFPVKQCLRYGMFLGWPVHPQFDAIKNEKKAKNIGNFKWQRILKTSLAQTH